MLSFRMVRRSREMARRVVEPPHHRRRRRRARVSGLRADDGHPARVLPDPTFPAPARPCLCCQGPSLRSHSADCSTCYYTRAVGRGPRHATWTVPAAASPTSPRPSAPAAGWCSPRRVAAPRPGRRASAPCAARPVARGLAPCPTLAGRAAVGAGRRRGAPGRCARRATHAAVPPVAEARRRPRTAARRAARAARRRRRRARSRRPTADGPGRSDRRGRGRAAADEDRDAAAALAALQMRAPPIGPEDIAAAEDLFAPLPRSGAGPARVRAARRERDRASGRPALRRGVGAPRARRVRSRRRAPTSRRGMLGRPRRRPATGPAPRRRPACCSRLVPGDARRRLARWRTRSSARTARARRSSC